MTALPIRTRRQSAAWVASDYWEMAKRSLRHIRHDPEQLVNVTLQPVLIVVLADFLFGGAINTGTHGSYINFVMPGHVIADLARGLVGLAVAIAAGFAVGFRPAAGMGGWATAVPVFLLVTLALSLLAALI